MSDDYGIDKFGMPLDTPSVQGEDERALAALESRIDLWRGKYLPRLDGPNDREDLLYIIAMDAMAALRSRLAESDEMKGMQSCGPDGPEGHDAIPRNSEPAQAAPSEEAERLYDSIDSLARDYDSYEYGLPNREIIPDGARLILDAIRAALASERGKREGASTELVKARERIAKLYAVALTLEDTEWRDGYLDAIQDFEREPIAPRPAPDAAALREALTWIETAQETLQPDRDIPCDDQAWVQIERARETLAALLRSEPRGEEGRI